MQTPGRLPLTISKRGRGWRKKLQWWAPWPLELAHPRRPLCHQPRERRQRGRDVVVTEISRAGHLAHLDWQALVHTPRNTHLVDYIRWPLFGYPASRVPGTQYRDKKGQPIWPLFLDVMMIEELRSFPEPLFFISQSLYVARRRARLVALGSLLGDLYQGLHHYS